MRLYTYIKTFAGLTKSELNEIYNKNLITVNGKNEKLTYLVKNGDVIIANDKEIKMIDYEYYLYYKPMGVLSVINNSTDSYINKINKDIKLVPAGRLDKESEGLMLLTNDGEYINDICANNSIEKEYIVTLKDKITDSFLRNVENPIIIKGKTTNPIKARKIDDYNVTMILTDGKYHQIRRVISTNGNKVINLKRIRIGDFYLDDMIPGEIRKIKRL